MADIVPFQARRSSALASAVHDRCGAPSDEGCGRNQAEALAKTEIRKTIILLDLALQHAWEISRVIADPALRKVFDRHIGSIEQSLQIARDRVIEI